MRGKRLGSDIFWSGTELALRYGMQLASIVILSRFIPPEGFGLMAMVMVVVAIGNVISDSGMTVALTRLPEATPTHFATARRFSLLCGVACVIVSCTVAVPLARMLAQPALAGLLAVASCALPAIGAATAADARLIREGRFIERTKAQFTASLAGSLLAVGVAIAGGGAWALVTQLVATAAVRMVLLESFAHTRARPSMSALRTLLPMSGYLAISGLLDAFANRAQAVLLGRLFGATELGFYAQAQTIQQVPTTAFGAIANKVALPRFSEALRTERLAEVASICLRGTWLLFCPAMVLVSMLAPLLVPWLLGGRWAPAAPILSVLCIGAALWPLHVVNVLVCTAKGDGRAFFAIEVVKKLLLLAAIAAFGWRGPIAMAWALVLSSLLGGVVNARYSGRAIGYGPWAQARDLAPGALATVVAAVTAQITADALGGHVLAMAAMAAVFTITYAVPAIFLGRRALHAWKSVDAALPDGPTPPQAPSI